MGILKVLVSPMQCTYLDMYVSLTPISDQIGMSTVTTIPGFGIIQKHIPMYSRLPNPALLIPSFNMYILTKFMINFVSFLALL